VAPLALAALVAGAQQPAATPGLPTAVEAAWLRAQEAADAQGQLLRGEASRAAAASLLPAPASVELSQRDGRWIDRGAGAGRETEAALALPLWLPGQRGVRGALADADAARAQAALAHARWQVAGQVRELAWRVVEARADLRQAEAQRDALERLGNDVDRRVKAGDLARADLLAARAEALNARATAREAQVRLTGLERQWTSLVGVTALEREQLDEPKATEQAPAQHPQLLLAERQLAQAQRQQDWTIADRRDPPELLLRYRQETGGGEPGSRNSAGIGIRIPFGGDVRNRPLQAQAASAALVAERQLAALRLQVDTTRRQAEEAHAASLERLAVDRERSALAKERAQLIQRAFDAGDHGLPDLLRALAASAAAQADFERSQAVVGLAHARLLQAQGLIP
jgi:outer membrane protein, heavy metal efflux system